MFVSTAPSDAAELPQTKQLDCTTSDAAPVVDTVLAGLEAVRTAVALALKDSDYATLPISRAADIGFGVAFTALFASSAYYGFSSTAECSSEMERRERALHERASVGSAASVAPSRRAFSTATAPREIAGFAFGASRDAARAVCESASFQWTPSGNAYQCSGNPGGTGIEAAARITFCADEICRIELLIAPENDEQAASFERFKKILQDLSARYERPTAREVVYADSSCAGSKLLECLRSGSAHFRYEWRWINRKRVVLWLGSRNQPTSTGDGADTLAATTIHIRYEDGRGPDPVKLPATPEVTPPVAPATPSEGARPQEQLSESKESAPQAAPSDVGQHAAQPAPSDVGQHAAQPPTSQSGRGGPPQRP